MLTLKKLKIKNIGRFVTEQVIEFDGLGELVQVDGNFIDSGGSSGSGKSTFFKSADYLLGLNDIPVTVLQSRLTKEGIHVVGNFDWDGKEVELVRGKGKLSIEIDGTLIEGSNKLVEEKIDEMLGLPRDLFRPIFHKRQKEGGFFLKMGPSDKNEFLTDILGQQENRKRIKAIEDDIKTFEGALKMFQTDLSNGQASLLATQDAILALGMAPVRDMHQAVVDDLKTKLDASEAALKAIQDAHSQQNALLDGQRPAPEAPPQISMPPLDSSPFDKTTLDGATAELDLIRQSLKNIEDSERARLVKVNQLINERKINLSVLQHKITMANIAKNEATVLAGEIKQLRECVCPTCQQSWVAEAAKVRENDLLVKLSALRTQIVEGGNAENDITKTNMEIEVLTRELVGQEHPELVHYKDLEVAFTAIVVKQREAMNTHAAKVAATNAVIMGKHEAERKAALENFHARQTERNVEFTAKQSALRTQQTQEIEQVRGQVQVDRFAHQTAANALSSYEQRIATYTASFNTLKAKEEEHSKKVNFSTNELNALANRILVAEETKRAIKSFMSISFEDALEEIGDTATSIIRNVPNMVNATIQFQGTKETAKGSVKEEVNAVISMDGEEGVDIRSLSGGEGSAADLAIDLAVIELIENRSNKGINVFILDEPFNGLGTTEIEPTLEMLKQLKTNKNIIIVDHNDAVKEMVSSRILVTREGLYSTIEQVS